MAVLKIAVGRLVMSTWLPKVSAVDILKQANYTIVPPTASPLHQEPGSATVSTVRLQAICDGGDVGSQIGRSVVAWLPEVGEQLSEEQRLSHQSEERWDQWRDA